MTFVNKPDWKDAPDWANHLAMDADGSWWWYEHRPVPGDNEDARYFRGYALGQFKCASMPSEVDWRATLEDRPVAEQPEQDVNGA